MLLNPERNTNAHRPTRYLLNDLIDCGVCGARLFSRTRDDHTKRYLCASRRRGHQLSILAVPVDELVAGQVLNLLTTASVRNALLAQADARVGTSLAATLAALGAAQSRLQILDDDYVRGALIQGGYATTELIDGARYDPASDTWVPLSPSPLGVRQGPGMVWAGERVIIWGGVAPGARGGEPSPYYDDGATLTLG